MHKVSISRLGMSQMWLMYFNNCHFCSVYKQQNHTVKMTTSFGRMFL